VGIRSPSPHLSLKGAQGNKVQKTIWEWW